MIRTATRRSSVAEAGAQATLESSPREAESIMLKTSVLSTILVNVLTLAAIAQRLPQQVPPAHIRTALRVDEDYLLQFNSVQDEIEMSPNQRARRKVISDKFYRDRDRRSQEFQDRLRELGEDADPQVLAALRQEFAATWWDVADEMEAAAVKVLDRRQHARLEEIRLQIEGPNAFLRADFQKQLNVSLDQIELFTPLIRQWRLDIRQSLQNSSSEISKLLGPQIPGKGRRLDPAKKEAFKNVNENFRREADGIRQSIERTIAKALTKKQLENYKKMLGELFDFMRLTLVPESPVVEAKADAKASKSDRDGENAVAK
jgi:hypothetical protein